MEQNTQNIQNNKNIKFTKLNRNIQNIQIYIYNDKKWNQKNVKECDKWKKPYNHQTSCDLCIL